MDQFRDGLGEAWATVATFVPQLIAFVLILVVGYFIAKAFEKVIDGVLERVGFDNWVERGGVKQALARSKYDASSLLAKLVFFVVMLFVLQLAFGIFGPNPVNDMIAGIVSYLPNVFAAVVILVVGFAIAAGVKEMVQAAIGGLSYGRALAMVAGTAISVIAVFAALSQLRIAPAIVNGLFYALLAIIVGSSIVAIGGGGIKTMQQYWDRAARRVERESDQIRDEAEGAGDRVKERAQQRREQLQPAGAGTRGSSGTASSSSEDEGGVGEAMKRDLEQTKSDMPGAEGRDLNQDVGDTVRQATGKQQTPPPDRRNPNS